jgi:hypothetical protein
MKRWSIGLLGCLVLTVCAFGLYTRFLNDNHAFHSKKDRKYHEYKIVPSYTKLDNKGNPLPNSASHWGMVRDNNSGLIWEVKQNMDGVKNYSDPHDADNKYTWYDSNPTTNGGAAGSKNGIRNTESFLSALNVDYFGGYSDWRLPTQVELFSLVSRDRFLPAISNDYFPNIKTAHYWSSISAKIMYGAWGVDFSFGYGGSYYKGYYFYALAVRGKCK